MSVSVTRRAVCQGLSAAGVLAASSLPLASHAESSMHERSIPSSGESLPVVGLGTSDVFDVGKGASEREPLEEVLRIQLNAGGSLLDTSPMYGNSEEVAGDLIAKLQFRPKMFLATKVWTRGREAGMQQIENSMRLLKASKLDLI